MRFFSYSLERHNDGELIREKCENGDYEKVETEQVFAFFFLVFI